MDEINFSKISFPNLPDVDPDTWRKISEAMTRRINESLGVPAALFENTEPSSLTTARLLETVSRLPTLPKLPVNFTLGIDDLLSTLRLLKQHGYTRRRGRTVTRGKANSYGIYTQSQWGQPVEIVRLYVDVSRTMPRGTFYQFDTPSFDLGFRRKF